MVNRHPDGERTTEARLRAAVESAPSGLLMSDEDGRIVLVNREIERLFGYPREEILGRPVDMLIPERFRAAHPQFRSGFAREPRIRAMGAGRELFGRRKDGSEVPVEIGLTPVATEDGLYVISSIVDVTERKRAEGLVRTAVEASPNGTVMIDTQGRMVLVNRALEAMFGYSREELLGQTIEKLVPGRFRHEHPEFRARFEAHPSTRAMGAERELYGVRKDGSEIPVEIGLNPIETAEGLFVLSSVVDVSARKAAEAERRKLEERLRQAQKMEAVGTLAGGVAHDFRNILTGIVAYAEMLKSATRDPLMAEDLAQVLAFADRGKHLVDRLLTFSRRQPTHRKLGQLGAAVTEAAKLLRATLPTSLELDIEVEPATPMVLADHNAVQHVLMNLATNAAHAMKNTGRMEVRLLPYYVKDSVARANPDLREGTYALLTVRDSGHGMDQRTRERAMEPFFTTKGLGEGTGLGLSIVHGIMRDHDGAVQIESTPGTGTLVRCFFPAAPETEMRAEAPAPAVPSGRGQRILFVDDEPTLATVGVRRLRHLGYDAVGCDDSTQALQLFLAQPESFDAVVTDLTMPGLNGLQLAQRIRAVRPTIPILLQTGNAAALDPVQQEQLGVAVVLLKPVATAELAQALMQVLDPAPQQQPVP